MMPIKHFYQEILTKKPLINFEGYCLFPKVSQENLTKKNKQKIKKRTFFIIESHLHKLLKNAVAKELLQTNYKLYFESPTSPVKRLWWTAYRPDILAIIQDESSFHVILVECETNPTKSRILRKTNQIKKVLALQKRLNEKHLILPLLAIPQLNLHKINCKEIRDFWEIWIINQLSEITHKLYRI